MIVNSVFQKRNVVRLGMVSLLVLGLFLLLRGVSGEVSAASILKLERVEPYSVGIGNPFSPVLTDTLPLRQFLPVIGKQYNAIPPVSIIDAFTVHGVETVTDVTIVSGTTESTYLVRWMAPVQFQWSVRNADHVFWGPVSESIFTAVPVSGSVTVVITQANRYLLRALNEAGAETVNFINIRLANTQMPPPYNVSGIVTQTGRALITWDFSTTTTSTLALVRGFRIYRSLDEGLTFTEVGEVRGAENNPPTPPYQWLDTASGCGMGYLVKTIYLNISDNQLRESDYSATRYQTLPCVASEPPSSPFDVNGVFTAPNQALITWSFVETDTEILNLVRGFRIYRSQDGGYNFTQVGEFNGFTSPYQWGDSDSGCGRIYQVKTVYWDVINSRLAETDFSSSRFMTPACPLRRRN